MQESLADFIRRADTVDFMAISSSRLLQYVKTRPYIHLGPLLDFDYRIGYTDTGHIEAVFRDLGSDFVGFFPRILSPLGQQSNDAAGITPVLEQPYLGISGAGVLLGIIDSGIDYTQSVFRHADGSTRILSLWDQTLEGARGEGLPYGAEFLEETINRALRSEDPLAIVPSVDEEGHGTFLASVAAGSRVDEFIGTAPATSLLVVKLRRAHPYYIKKFLLPEAEQALYSSSDLLMGADYIFAQAQQRNMPVVLCLGLGSNLSGHDGNTPVEDYLSLMLQKNGLACVTAGGNESNEKHHTQGSIGQSGEMESIPLRVGGRAASFTIGIFAASFDRISVGITSPSGEVVSRVPFKLGLQFQTELTIDRTRISIAYYKDSSSVIILGFEEAKEGIWEINLYGDSILSGVYHAWLPITGQVSPLVEFMRPVPEFTVVYPATSLRTTTCGAYNSRNNTLYVSSSWGPTRLPRMTPDLVAPGVEVGGVYPAGAGLMTGTSAAAAVAAGATALLLEWGIVQGRMRAMDGDTARLLLIGGAKRDEGILYPNTRWGFGKLDLYGSFLRMKESGIIYDQSGGIL